MTNDRFRIHLLSGNDMRRNPQDVDGPKDPTQLLKYTIFYLMVAAILLSAHRAARDPMPRANRVQLASNLQIDPSVAPKFEKNPTGRNAAGDGSLRCPFPVHESGKPADLLLRIPGTNRPMGQIV
jgi:hypothetical protein